MPNSHFPPKESMTRRAAGAIALKALCHQHLSVAHLRPDCSAVVRGCDCEIGRAYRVISHALVPTTWPVGENDLLTNAQVAAKVRQDRNQEVKS